MRDHGGNIDKAMQQFGGDPADWIDLSTGINRAPYPVPALPDHAWRALPTRADMAALSNAAARAYDSPAAILPLPGAQAAIQMIPRLLPPGQARVLAPTYNEHAASLRAAGWQVTEVAAVSDLPGADLAVIVNPNNPDGRETTPADLLALAGQVGTLIVDESFADPRPDLSVAPHAGTRRGLFVLRSFGKFYGLAGLRLGFALGHPDDIAPMAELAGPWPICGAAVEIGQRALADRNWATTTTSRLRAEAARLDNIALRAGWALIGGTELFRLYHTPNAEEAQTRLARAHIWTRTFPWSDHLIRLGLPGPKPEWTRIAQALS
ncbi:threonine-phosphate decarboxylase CobD [Actibacterium sp. XHP0104]|uniref:threonine-phosphate decarboxylase CobD n=1 Tax=Actibacterium sp. XHP0104 TaxID=2984335 RepID=UPI0021E98487|nr:threonine-phosphate decarboxylase CobD [Actibacterium sp. XHP0104]MCV2882723.1 threonine-phosphate decarboxylase CobD [Actibacterium sp. XHP0104]